MLLGMIRVKNVAIRPLCGMALSSADVERVTKWGSGSLLWRGRSTVISSGFEVEFFDNGVGDLGDVEARRSSRNAG